MKKFRNFLILTIVGYIAGVVASGFLLESKFEDIVALFTSTYALIGLGAGIFLGLFALIGKTDSTKKPTSSSTGTNASGDKVDQYYDAKWVTESDLDKNPSYMPITYSRLDTVKKSGIVIRNTLSKSGELKINMYDPIHTLVIGTTGSGKTTTVIEPAIRILSKTAEKPCMVITDPKGELYNNHSIQLRENGYRIMVLDLRNPYASTRWNPLDNAYCMYHRAQKLEKEIKIHKAGNPKDFKLITLPNTKYDAVWYEFNGVAYPNQESLKGDMLAKKQELVDMSENELREVCSSVMPVGKGENSSWERGAQDFLFAIMLAMLEDSTNPDLGLTREKFNFYNVTKIAFTRDPDANNQFGTLKKYFQGRDTLSKAAGMASTVINNAETTARGYMGVLQGRLSTFQDAGICYATSFSDMKFDDFTSQPTVLFIKVPDEKESRHCIATICISQLYQKLIEIAGKYPSLKLPRPVYFILDEFANLPKIEKMDSMITVARSRRIFFELVVQSYSQLDDKYGKESANTIKGNCNIQIFIGTEDQQTKEEFSKMCGDVSIKVENESVSKSEKKESEASTTKSVQTVTRPLIYPYELGQLEPNTAIVKIFKHNPMKHKLTPWYKTPQFDQRKANEGYVQSRALDERAVFYDIRERNKKVLKPSSSSNPFGGFGF